MIDPIWAISTLYETPHHAEVRDRDDAPCRVWKNPTKVAFIKAIHSLSTTGLRAVLTASDLFVWQSVNLPHGDFEADTGLAGLRLQLRSELVNVNDAAIAQPECFPWVFDLAAAGVMDLDARRILVGDWLLANGRLNCVYPAGFAIVWYL